MSIIFRNLFIVCSVITFAVSGLCSDVASRLGSSVTFDLAKVYKIWLCNPEKMNHPLGGDINEYRLFLHRKNFPNDTITLISNYEDFSPEFQDQLKGISETYGINLLSLNEIEKAIYEMPGLYDQNEQLKLLAFARREISHPRGCLASASDIIRVLSPAIKLGMYLDLDCHKEKTIKSVVNATYGVLISGGMESPCNNIILADESANKLLKAFRAKIFAKYTKIEGSIDYLKDKYGLTDEVVVKIRNHSTIDSEDKFTPEAIKFRSGLSNIISTLQEGNTDESYYYKRLFQYFLQDISGPDCLTDCLNELKFANKDEVVSFNVKACIEIQCLVPNSIPFKNESDTSWIPGENCLESKNDLFNYLLKMIEKPSRSENEEQEITRILSLLSKDKYNEQKEREGFGLPVSIELLKEFLSTRANK